MTAPTLTFSRRGLDRQAAQLGRITVAMIVSSGTGAKWFIHLPGAGFCSGSSASFDKARRKVEHEVREWFLAAGLEDVASKLVVRVLTEQEERTRARA